MAKCVICGKENDGFICSHCLAKGASNVGNGVKKVGKILSVVGPMVFTYVLTKGKGRPKV
jgi:rRNA processing protein Gar1